MRKRLLMISLLFLFVIAGSFAQDYRGIVVSTDYPSITTANRDLIIFNLKVSDYNQAPQRVNLSLIGLPENWQYAFIGGGGLIEAVFASPDNSADVQLWLDPPDDTKAGIYNFTVRITGKFGRYDLPVSIKIGDELPQRLVLKPEIPELSGSPSANFSYRVKLTNRSAREAMVNLRAEAPEGFNVTFKKKYGDQEITAIPVDAGKDVDLEIKIKPAHDTAAGSYNIKILAETKTVSSSTELKLTIKGQPDLVISTPDGRLSDRAVAGKTRAINITVKNKGVEASGEIKLRGSAPRNWEVSFEPEKIESLAPGKSVDIVASVTPGSEAVTGDYNVTIRAESSKTTASEKFRITVRTSALWGIVAVLIIAMALAVVVFAIKRYGRR